MEICSIRTPIQPMIPDFQLLDPSFSVNGGGERLAHLHAFATPPLDFSPFIHPQRKEGKSVKQDYSSLKEGMMI